MAKAPRVIVGEEFPHTKEGMEQMIGKLKVKVSDMQEDLIPGLRPENEKQLRGIAAEWLAEKKELAKRKKRFEKIDDALRQEVTSAGLQPLEDGTTRFSVDGYEVVLEPVKPRLKVTPVESDEDGGE